MFIICAVVLSMIPFKVFANLTNEQKQNMVEVKLRKAKSVTISNNKATIEYDGGTVEVTGDNLVNEQITWNYGDHTGPMEVLYTTSTSLTFTTIPDQGFSAFAFDNGTRQRVQNNTFTLSNLTTAANNPQQYETEFEFEFEGGGHGERYSWNGDSVYFIWGTEGEENNFYYHKITGIVGGGFDGYEINYVPVSTIVAENDNTVHYDLSQKERTWHFSDGRTDFHDNYHFVYVEALEEALNDAEFTSASTTRKLEYLREEEMTLDPTGANSGNNSISTNGNRNFRLTIYNDAPNAYEELRVGVPTTFEFFPEFWNRVFHSDVVDISATTEEAPVIFDTFLLEKTIQINSAQFSRSISNVKALNVPNKAVTIANAGEGKWNITFNSNFYNVVEFELTDANGQKYYITLHRINLQIKGLIGDETHSKYAAIYYPDTNSYTDYSVVCTVVYKNGTTETTIVGTPVKGIDTEGGDRVQEYEISGGLHLKTAWYKLPNIEDGQNTNISKFFVTVVKGSDFSGDTYQGTLAGSGLGTEFRNEGFGFYEVIE